MAYKIMLLHIGDKAEDKDELVHLMTSSIDGTCSLTMDDGTRLEVHITDVTQQPGSGRAQISVRRGNGAGAILIYDTTRRETFAPCMEWLDAFKRYASKEAVTIVVANRSHEHCRNTVVSMEEGERFAKNIGSLYYDVDKRSPNTAHEALLHIVTCIFEKMKNDTLGKRPEDGIKPLPFHVPPPRRYSTNSLPNDDSTAGKEVVPTVAKLQSKLSFLHQEVQKMRQQHEMDSTRQVSLQQHQKDLVSKISELSHELECQRSQCASLQQRCSALEQENSQLRGETQRCQMQTSSQLQENNQLREALRGETQRCQMQASSQLQENSQLREALRGETQRCQMQASSQLQENSQLREALRGETQRCQMQASSQLQENSQLREALSSQTQETGRLRDALRDQTQKNVTMTQKLQYQLGLKEDALQSQVSLREESSAALRELELALSQAMAEIRTLQVRKTSNEIDHWKVSRHEILVLQGKMLGHGAWGYVAEGKFRGKSVAVKCLHEEIMSQQTVERVHREIRTMAHVRHPNLVLFIAAVIDEGPPMIISELLDTNLRTAYENRLLIGTDVKIEILHAIACALNYLHKQREPIIHRDVSAPNVLLEATGNGKWTPKVSDFGSANLARLSQTLGEGAIIYAAPETYPESPHRAVHTPKIDVYSYGVLLGEVLTEQLPNPEALFYTLQYVEAQWPQIHRLMVMCTKQSPNERPDMATVIEHMDAFCPL